MIVFESFRAREGEKKALVYVLSLGGTITALADQQQDVLYTHSTIDIQTLVSELPLKSEPVTVVAEQITHQISHEQSFDELCALAEKINELIHRDEVDGVVVAQGTNAIEESAYFMSLVIQTKKTIVFTGSFRPYNALGYDGGRNLYNAIVLASNRDVVGLGVVLTFNDAVVCARDACKLNPSLINDFSMNGLGVIGAIEGTAVYVYNIPAHRHSFTSEFSFRINNLFHKVFILYGSLGADATFVHAAIQNNAIGIISAGMGKGYQSKSVTDALKEASARGVVVVRTTRTGLGFAHVDPTIDHDAGFIVGCGLSPHKARILLALALDKTKNKVEIQRIFDTY